MISGFTGTGGTAATSDIIDVDGSGKAGDHVVWTRNGASGTLQVENASNDVLESMTLEGTYEQNHFVVTGSGSVDQISYDPSIVVILNKTQYVGSGPGNSRSASGIGIVSGGVQYVGYDSGTGTATSTTIFSGGYQYIGDNKGTGTATNTTINGGGYQFVGVSGGTGMATSTTILGGEQVVSSGGTATDTTVYSGGLADVLSGGVVNAPVIDGGTLELAEGAKIGTRPITESCAGATLTVAENLSYAGALTQGAGSKLVVDSDDKLTLSGTNSLSGSTSGAGTLALKGGDTTFSTGATLTTSAWSLTGSGTTATLGEALTYAGAFSAAAGTHLTLNGGALTLKGATTLAGVTISSASSHALNLYGATAVSGLTIGGDAIVGNYATATAKRRLDHDRRRGRHRQGRAYQRGRENLGHRRQQRHRARRRRGFVHRQRRPAREDRRDRDEHGRARDNQYRQD